MIAPVLEEIADEEEDRMKIVKVDIDEKRNRSKVRIDERPHSPILQRWRIGGSGGRI